MSAFDISRQGDAKTFRVALKAKADSMTPSAFDISRLGPARSQSSVTKRMSEGLGLRMSMGPGPAFCIPKTSSRVPSALKRVIESGYDQLPSIGIV